MISRLLKRKRIQPIKMKIYVSDFNQSVTIEKSSKDNAIELDFRNENKILSEPMFTLFLSNEDAAVLADGLLNFVKNGKR